MGDWQRELADLQETLERLQVERFRLIGLLEEHLSPDLVAQLLDGTRQLQLGGQRERVAVLFCDLRGFTRFTSQQPPDVVVAHLNQFFHAMTTVLFKHGATVDKFIGDAILAYFRQQESTDAEVARRVAACAFEMRDRFAALSAGWALGGQLGLGLGVAYGEVVLGHVGSGKHVDFTVIGSPVNLASRLCALAGGGEVLATEALVALLAGDAGWEPLPPLKIKGFEEPVVVRVHRGTPGA